MESKTPKFDNLIEKLLSELVPQMKNCHECSKEFTVENEDIEFYKMFRVPPSKLCPDCRNRQRLSFANYSNIYKRKCDVPGHTDIMISPVAPVMPWVTYDYETYYSDKWDPMSYGKDILLEESFFSQFLNLLKEIPQPGVRRGAESPNSDFSFYGKFMKDCYYVFGGRRSEDILYSSSIYDSKHVVDSYILRAVDTGYQHVATNDCYKCMYAYFSSNCIDSEFIHDCHNCQNCFGCTNLRNKQYCWFNEQLSKEEYQNRRQSVDLGDQDVNKDYQKKFWDFVKENPVRGSRIMNSQNVSGSDIRGSKDVHMGFQVENSENLRYAYFAIVNLKDSMDTNHSGGSERMYYSQNTGTKSSNVKFSFAVKETTDSEFLMSCTNCTNCFGCVGLKNASYCIFNKKYEPTEYFKKLDEVKTKMLIDGTYGEFFPMSFSPCAYNSSFAHIMYPMTEELAVSRGLYWQTEINIDTSSVKIVSLNDLPKNIKDVDDDICNIAILGENSHKPFKVVSREISFYKRYNLALPTETPYQRMIDRFKIMSNFRIEKDNCFKCGKEILSAYKTIDGYKPYCSECYKLDFL